MKDKTCAQCRFFAELNPTSNIGHCHRYAPRWGQGGRVAVDDWFPSVPQWTFCGEFQASE